MFALFSEKPKLTWRPVKAGDKIMQTQSYFSMYEFIWLLKNYHTKVVCFHLQHDTGIFLEGRGTRKFLSFCCYSSYEFRFEILIYCIFRCALKTVLNTYMYLGNRNDIWIINMKLFQWSFCMKHLCLLCLTTSL